VDQLHCTGIGRVIRVPVGSRVASCREGVEQRAGKRGKAEKPPGAASGTVRPPAASRVGTVPGHRGPQATRGRRMEVLGDCQFTSLPRRP